MTAGSAPTPASTPASGSQAPRPATAAAREGGPGTRIRWVVVPLDGSPFGEQALPYARQLAQALGATVLLVTAAHLDMLAAADAGAAPVSAELMQTLLDQELSVTRNYLAGVKQRLEATGLTVETMSDFGYPAGYIREAIAQRPDSLVVMTTHGRSGLARLALGSVADQIVRQSGHPVVVVRPDKDRPEVEHPIRHVLVALDGSALSEEVLPLALLVASGCGADLTLVRVAESEAETAGARDYLEGVAARIVGTIGGKPPAVRVPAGRPAEGILDAASEIGADLIAITTHGRGGIGRWLTGSTTDRVLQGSHLPILVIRGHERPAQG